MSGREEKWWSARDLADLLTYKWQNFERVLERAKAACAESRNDTEYHFTASSKVIAGGRYGTQTLSDIQLTLIRQSKRESLALNNGHGS